MEFVQYMELMKNCLITEQTMSLNFTSMSATTIQIEPNSNIYSLQMDNDFAVKLTTKLLQTYLVPVICFFGIMGNILTLLTLTRKRLKSSADGTERTVQVGLISLAISDLLLCTSLIPHAVFKGKFAYTEITPQLVYRTYGSGFINMFILTGTWLTVIMAVSRYLAICHPFKARHVIGMAGVKMSIGSVSFLCILFNAPRFLEYSIESATCRDGDSMYFRNNYILQGQWRTVYVWLYFSFGICLPLAVLTFCNMRLVKALRESSRMRRHYRVPAVHVDSNHRITSILVTIVLMYLLLVTPAELLLFLQDQYHDILKERYKTALVIAVEVTNVLQTINFSCNFSLYYVLNVNFRRGIHDMFLWCCVKAGVVERRATSTALARSTAAAAIAAQTRSSNHTRRASSLVRGGGGVGSTKSISNSNHQRKNSTQVPDGQMVEQAQLIESRPLRNGVITQAPLAEEVSMGEMSS